MDNDLVSALWSVLTNPNVVYILLIVGLWSAVAAFNVPGTGLPEVLAVICLVLAIAGLTQLQPNVVGVILVVASVVMFAIDLHMHSMALAAGAVVSLALGSVFLFPPAAGMLLLSPWLIAGMTLASAVFFGAVLSSAIRTRRMPARAISNTAIGKTGKVIAPIDPVGTVQVQSELWTAVADEPIGKGEEVEVVTLEGLKVRVRRVHQD
jgi:membrane-bound serine protease (ClpP class)